MDSVLNSFIVDVSPFNVFLLFPIDVMGALNYLKLNIDLRWITMWEMRNQCESHCISYYNFSAVSVVFCLIVILCNRQYMV